MNDIASQSDISQSVALLRAEIRADIAEFRADLTETIWLTLVLTNLTLLVAVIGYVQIALK